MVGRNETQVSVRKNRRESGAPKRGRNPGGEKAEVVEEGFPTAQKSRSSRTTSNLLTGGRFADNVCLRCRAPAVIYLTVFGGLHDFPPSQSGGRAILPALPRFPD